MKKAMSLLLSLMLVPCFFSVSALDSTRKGWGQGYHVNDMNQPIDCIKYNDLYNQYNTTFLKNSENEIVLTFDEGYENGFTSKILDVLKAKNTKAVFFITYDYAKRNPDLVKRMIAEGHTLGNHSTTHPSMACLSQAEIEKEIVTLHNFVKDNFNYNMNLFRPPMGEFSEQSLYYTKQLGYKTIFWSFAYKDYDVNNQPDYNAAIKRTNDALHPGAIYLLHAVSRTNCRILGEWIDHVKTAGYKFTTEF